MADPMNIKFESIDMSLELEQRVNADKIAGGLSMDEGNNPLPQETVLTREQILQASHVGLKVFAAYASTKIIEQGKQIQDQRNQIQQLGNQFEQQKQELRDQFQQQKQELRERIEEQRKTIEWHQQQLQQFLAVQPNNWQTPPPPGNAGHQ